MSITKYIAKHLREIYFGGNWTTSNLKDTISDITWQQATQKVYDFNTIATLTFHTTYYVAALLKVLQGGPLDAKDALSFVHPEINTQQDWEQLLNKAWIDAEAAAMLIENMPDIKLHENFTDEKYGNYYRNIHGMIEHMHYHLGQIVLIKKIILQNS
jgi:uncharacterized damage-inducible protein DinB